MPTIKIKGSSTAAAEPLTLAERELAVNVTDKKLYVGDGAAVQKIVGSLGNQEASAVAITGGSIAGITDLAVADGGTGASTAADARTNLGVTATGADTTYAFRSNNLSDLASASTARTNLGLGSIATQASSSVSITGGSITGVTDIAIADGGTGASTAADARTNLGLGSIATQSASSVAITGGTISGITDLAVADGGTGASTAADARTNLSVPSTTGSGASGTWGIDISGNAATATSSTTATNLAGGAANRVPYQSASGTTTFVAAPTVTNSYLKWNGTALGWDTVSGGGGGSGDVVGPASATDNQIVLFDGTTGDFIKAATTTGLLKASSGVIAAAVSGTDYAPATSGSAILKGNGSGGFSNAAAGTDYAAATTGTSSELLGSNGSGGFSNVTVGSGLSYSAGTLSATGGGGGTPGGSNTQVQFNDGGSFGGDAGLTYDKATDVLTVAGSFNGPHNGTVGATTANTGAFTTLSASSTVSGTGFSTYLASPPAIGGTTAAAGSFTTLSATGNVTLSGGTANGVAYLNGSKVLTTGSALTFDGTTLTAPTINAASLVVSRSTGWTQSSDTYTTTSSGATDVHNSMRRCLLRDDGSVNYYLSATDSTKKEDGTTSSVLTGADGMVMVEIPAFYVKFTPGSTRTWAISLFPSPGYTLHPAFIKDGEYVPYRYYGAYDACVNSTGSTYESGLNYDNNWTSGQNWSADATPKLASVSGIYPAVGITRAQGRTLAANRGTGWRQVDAYLSWAVELLFLVEYGTFRTQQNIGDGNVSVSTGYPASSGNQTDSPHSVAGKSNSIGNASTNTTNGASSGTRDTAFMSYRGIENWYGNCWNWVDGYNINTNQAYVSNTRANFADDTATNYNAIGAAMVATNGYVTNCQNEPFAFLPSAVGGSSSTYWADYYYQASGWRVALFGGNAYNGALAGGFCWGLDDDSSAAARAVGARLAF